MFRLLRKIGKEDLYETELKAAVRADMFNKKILADGLDNFIIRPNVFIAAYVYPELLTKKEWNTVFDSMLHKLWLKWGGLSTIDKSHPLYLSAHTGQDLRSYHRGDSWFWINNLAAIVLYRLDRKKYWKYISKIIAASVQEMLYMGYTGYSSEVSSATELKSEGCWGQAWSSAMFIELIGEIYG
jgi:glycogen debranching enzyme